MRQVKLWVNPNEMKNIHDKGFPNSYSLQQKEGLVEVTISSEEFQQWQLKERNPMFERSYTGKQLLKD